MLRDILYRSAEMHPFNVIRCSIVCAVLYFVSAAPPSTSTLNHHATTSIASSTTQPPHVGTTSANISDSKTALEIVSDLSGKQVVERSYGDIINYLLRVEKNQERKGVERLLRVFIIETKSVKKYERREWRTASSIWKL